MQEKQHKRKSSKYRFMTNAAKISYKLNSSYLYIEKKNDNINFQVIRSLFAIYLQTDSLLNGYHQKTPYQESPKQSTKQYIHDFFDRTSSINIFSLAA
jgi:hypothetical protein